MAKHERTVYVKKSFIDMIERYLHKEPKDSSACLGEDETISVTTKFDNGVEMDIKCCGVQYKEGESNTAWSEAVLFKNGSQVACTEPSDTFDGDWELECADGDTYIAHVIPIN